MDDCYYYWIDIGPYACSWMLYPPMRAYAEALRWNAIKQASTRNHIYHCFVYYSRPATSLSCRLFTQRIILQITGTWTKTILLSISCMNYPDEDIGHGGIQTAESGRFIWDWRSPGKVSALQAAIFITTIGEFNFGSCIILWSSSLLF